MKNIHVFYIKLLFTAALLYYFFHYLVTGEGGLLNILLPFVYITWVGSDFMRHRKNNTWQEPYTFKN
ncbi:hypothetical protein N780_05580 [Pontibacillus chungwhensis BH030062]|uniref:Uncharacterized protein n=1 Tax=Pontibacillus chungwhensis BH030062 TaxID=1385513 RepID=A0A0A2UUK7_9BACI|nr:hypothetical protein N780_05580 [Pontibacillus chungwhensis BH030062]